MTARVAAIAMVAVCWVGMACAQSRETAATASPHGSERRVTLDAVVTDSSGRRVTGLTAQDFAVKDNGQPVRLQAFQAKQPGAVDTSTTVMLVLDNFNDVRAGMSHERDDLKRFLMQNGGRLPVPMSLTIFAASGVKSTNLTLNGKALADYLEKTPVALRAMPTNNAAYVAMELGGRTLEGLKSIADSDVARRPGHKLLVWIGGGWPIVINPAMMEGRSQKQKDATFAEIVGISNLLRQNRITLYNANSIHIDNLNEDAAYKAYLKAPATANDALPGGLKVEVIATQTGGTVQNASSDLAEELEHVTPDAEGFYTISFDAPAAAKANEYHALTVAVEKQGAAARTRTGYYSQP